MTAVLRLLALVAMLLMPLGMATAPAEPAQHHDAMAAMPMEHCPDQQENADFQGNVGDCAMPCSAALPAAELSPSDLQPIARAPADPSPHVALVGILLEIATPPPKLS